MLQCAICDFKYVRLFKDHNHTTGIIRGYLCNTCNNVIATIENGNHSCGTRVIAVEGLFVIEIPCYKYHSYLEAPPLERFGMRYHN